MRFYIISLVLVCGATVAFVTMVIIDPNNLGVFGWIIAVFLVCCAIKFITDILKAMKAEAAFKRKVQIRNGNYPIVDDRVKQHARQIHNN